MMNKKVEINKNFEIYVLGYLTQAIDDNDSEYYNFAITQLDEIIYNITNEECEAHIKHNLIKNIINVEEINNYLLQFDISEFNINEFILLCKMYKLNKVYNEGE